MYKRQGIVLMVIGLLAAAVATLFSLNEKYNVKEIMFLVVGIAGDVYKRQGSSHYLSSLQLKASPHSL